MCHDIFRLSSGNYLLLAAIEKKNPNLQFLSIFWIWFMWPKIVTAGILSVVWKLKHPLTEFEVVISEVMQ